MAQVVSYCDKQITFIEGPFVCCDIGRIEVEYNNCRSICIDASIGILLSVKKGFHGGRFRTINEKILGLIDWLNQQVKDGEIIKVGGFWIAKEQDGINPEYNSLFAKRDAVSEHLLVK